MSRSKIWAWTINARDSHPHETPTAPVLEIGVANVIYYKYQMEMGETGRKHIQGCIRFLTLKSMDQVKGVLGCPWAHVEVARNWKALVDYCGKEETRIGGTKEEGDSGQQGKRTDIAAVATGLKAGMTCQQIAQQYPETYMRYPKGITMLHAAMHEPLFRPNLKVFCLYGTTGIGKTYFVHKHFPKHYVVADMKSPWMDGYNQENVVLFDDYGPNMMPIDHLKRYLDIYRCSAPIKGGFVPWNPRIIFMTTNHRLGHWYNGGLVGDYDIAALQRRLTWIELTENRVSNEILIVNVMRQAGVPVPNSDHIQDASAAADAAATREDVDGGAMPDAPTQTSPQGIHDLSQHAIDLVRTDYVEPTIEDMILLRD